MKLTSTNLPKAFQQGGAHRSELSSALRPQVVQCSRNQPLSTVLVVSSRDAICHVMRHIVSRIRVPHVRRGCYPQGPSPRSILSSSFGVSHFLSPPFPCSAMSVDASSSISAFGSPPSLASGYFDTVWRGCGPGRVITGGEGGWGLMMGGRGLRDMLCTSMSTYGRSFSFVIVASFVT